MWASKFVEHSSKSKGLAFKIKQFQDMHTSKLIENILFSSVWPQNQGNSRQCATICWKLFKSKGSVFKIKDIIEMCPSKYVENPWILKGLAFKIKEIQEMRLSKFIPRF